MREGTHTPVTAEQIATIKLLEVKSKELGRRINRPFVLLMTSIVSPVLTDHMMLRFDSRIYRFRTKMISTLEANFQHATNTVFKAFLPKLAGYIKLLSRLQHQIQSGIFGTEFLTLSGAKDQLLYIYLKT